jgi:acyl-CoA-dependent ceramide synthase
LVVITVTVILTITFPSLSHEPKLSSSTDQIPLPTIQPWSTLPKLIHLSYFNPESGKYNKGLDDFYFIGFWVLIWLSLREILMKLLWNPLGSMIGLANSKLQRFSEQGWTLVYCTIFWCMGIVRKLLNSTVDNIY